MLVEDPLRMPLPTSVLTHKLELPAHDIEPPATRALATEPLSCDLTHVYRSD